VKRTQRRKAQCVRIKCPAGRTGRSFRFAVIGGLLTSPRKRRELQPALEALARQTYQHPIDPQKRIRLGFATIQRWYYQARHASDPNRVLARKRRIDAGGRPSISTALLELIKTQYQAHPAGACSCTMTTCARCARAARIRPLPATKAVCGACVKTAGTDG